jgi:lactoylglutathione lyase
MIKSIGTTAVVVSNAAKAMEWYREKLGFDVQGDPKTHWVVAGVKGFEARLHLCQSTSHEKGNTGIAFLCDDVQSTYEEFSKKGVQFTTPPTKKPWGTYAMLADPDGNEFWIIQE